MEEAGGSIPPGSTKQHLQEGPVSDWSLAGFVAGDGYFSVTRKLPSFADGDPRLRFVLGVHVARRDRPLLEALRTRLGVGSIKDAEPRRAHWQPTSTFTVNSLRAHHAAVIPFFTAFLIGGEKRHQFELWVQAMRAYERLHPTRYGKGPSTCKRPGCERPVRGQGVCRIHYYEITGH